MALDLRFPLGLMFVILGVIVTALGIFRPQQTLGINLNLCWGLVLLAFGAVMLLLSIFGKRPPKIKTGVVLENPEHPHPPH
jgi:hypothetical protein